MKTLGRDLRLFSPKNIAFDFNNPRGLSEAEIFADKQFPKLVTSIDKYGILEPLIIKPDEVNSSEYVLIDGERRLRAALKVGLEEVPALVAKDDTDGRILAYQIHTLREDWPKEAEAKAIKKIIADLKSEYTSIDDVELKRKLQEITAHKPHTLEDLLKLAKYEDEIIDQVISKKLNMSYLVQIESNFISPLKRHYPNICAQYGEDEVRQILITKALNEKLVNTRYLMDEFKVVFSDTKHKENIEKLLTSFLIGKTKSIKTTFGEYKKLLELKGKKVDVKSKAKKPRVVKGKKGTTVFEYKSIKITRQQQTLMHEVRTKFEAIASSFSDEEQQYMAEALYCLEKNCLKAATLMVWAGGISRILIYIEKNLVDFNKCTDAMRANPVQIYRHFASNFQRNAKTIEEIRKNSNDKQLLSYLHYKKFIKATECKKLFANYNTRCDCAHPTDITLSPNDVITIFDNIYDLVFNNSRIK